MGLGQTLGDRLAQMEGMDGAARCLEALRLQGRICNCRPLEFNTRLLEVATSVGAKVCMVSITIYRKEASFLSSVGYVPKPHLCHSSFHILERLEPHHIFLKKLKQNTKVATSCKIGYYT